MTQVNVSQDVPRLDTLVFYTNGTNSIYSGILKKVTATNTLIVLSEDNYAEKTLFAMGYNVGTEIQLSQLI